MADFPHYKAWAKGQPKNRREYWRYLVDVFGLIQQMLICRICGYMYGWREAEDLPECNSCGSINWAGVKLQHFPGGGGLV